MKKLFSILLCLVLAGNAFGQGIGSRMADTDFAIELGDSPFSLQPVSYLHFGFNLTFNAPDLLKDNSSFFKSQQFGFNIIELSCRPYSSGSFSIGADVEWNWYHLNSDYMFNPYSDIETVSSPNGNRVSIQPKTTMGITEVRRSILSVCTFEFPFNFTQMMGRAYFNIGASAELNIPGCVQFKGKKGTDSIDEMKGGTHYSNKITTNQFTYNVHAAIGYGGLGIYAKYRPKPVFKDGYGPQFQTLTIGLIMGLGF